MRDEGPLIPPSSLASSQMKMQFVPASHVHFLFFKAISAAFLAHFRTISYAFPQYILPTSQFNRRRVPQVVLRNFRYISCAFPQLILRVVVRSLSCALPQHKVRIPQLIVRIFRSISCATPQVPCAHGSASYRAHSTAYSAHCAAYRAHFPQHIVRNSAGTLRMRT